MDVKWLAFPLHPETPLEGQTLEQLFAGTGKDIPALLAKLKKAAEAEGLAFGDRTHTYNSRRAQELGKWAEEQGQGEAFHRAMFRAYFAHGRNIADYAVLRAEAAALGLDPDEAQRVLAEGAYAAAVDADWDYSRRMDVRAVPTFVMNGRGLVGAVPYQDLLKLVQTAQGGGLVL